MILNFDDYKNSIPLTPYVHSTGFITKERRGELCDVLLKFLLRERGMIAAFNTPYEAKRKVIRGYMNERMPFPVPADVLQAQDELFWHETLIRGIVSVQTLNPSDKCFMWQGDITRLDADAIVNAANSDLLGCFMPMHNCIDNVIHSRAGMQLRKDCAVIMGLQGDSEEEGGVKVTRAYNLPCKYVFHTVGPMPTRTVTDDDRSKLRSCYISCLDMAEKLNLKSIAFCCISTGVFNFPKGEAAEIAVGTVKRWYLKHPDTALRVIFDVYTDEDARVYENIFKFL